MADAVVLTKHGLQVEWLLRQPSLQRARISRGAESLRMDWGYDSAFRFFPVQADADFGYCLHPADLATNKCLALRAARKFAISLMSCTFTSRT